MNNVNQLKKSGLLPQGLKLSVTPPHTYTMYYADGPQTYNEHFVKLHANKEWANQVTFAYDAIFVTVSGACATIPFVGPALAFAVQIGANWFKNANLNSDGSLDFYAAYHYIGTNVGGIDVTAWPIPGTPPEAWQFAVNGLMQGVRFASPTLAGGAFNASHQFRLASVGQKSEDLAFDFNFAQEISVGDLSLTTINGVPFTSANTLNGNVKR